MVGARNKLKKLFLISFFGRENKMEHLIFTEGENKMEHLIFFGCVRHPAGERLASLGMKRMAGTFLGGV